MKKISLVLAILLGLAGSISAQAREMDVMSMADEGKWQELDALIDAGGNIQILDNEGNNPLMNSVKTSRSFVATLNSCVLQHDTSSTHSGSY